MNFQLFQSFSDQNQDTTGGTGLYPNGKFEVDDETQAPIYLVNLRDDCGFLPATTQNNPYIIPNGGQGSTTTMQGDLMCEVKRAIRLACPSPVPAGSTCKTPPRLCYNPNNLQAGSATCDATYTQEETNDQYFDHFSLSSINIGYEVTGMSHVGFRVNELTISGTPK